LRRCSQVMCGTPWGCLLVIGCGNDAIAWCRGKEEKRERFAFSLLLSYCTGSPMR
jgi:hypothetical protein